ncbi:MAG: cytochrome c oxidase subunit II [Bdellovibrionales bacterium]|nr:cytochrome c oxidase subunit II [Bdellovibrionales bacterium]
MFWPSSAQASTFMPVQASKIAMHVDSLYEFLLWASLISCVLVIGGFILFSIKYKRKSESDRTPYISHNNLLEFLWSFIPFVVFMVVFAWGFFVYREMRTMPQDGLEILVEGQKWNWTFYYKSGKISAGELWVPENTPIKLVMTSKDVIHSFYLPAFRNKQDVVPGRYTALTFNAEKKGDYQVFCTEYCGDQHSAMLAKLHVVTREEFDRWLANDPYKGLSLTEIGQKVYGSRCAMCHSQSDVKMVGPGWKGLYGSSRTFVSGDPVAKVDENYIRESILNPNAKVVVGFGPASAMPTFAGQLSEQEIMAIIELIKGLK